MVEMYRKPIIPAVNRYLGVLSASIISQETIALVASEQRKPASRLQRSLEEAISLTESLHIAVAEALAHSDDAQAQAEFYRDEVATRMHGLRSHIDLLETYTDRSFWPLPSYDDLLFRL